MKFKKPVNENYCANIVEIKTLIPLENCDNIQSTLIFGNRIIVSKDVKIGDVGVFFPAETQLSYEYAKYNNLHRHTELNVDQEKRGYLEDNRRIRTMKLRGNQSCGLFMPLGSLSFCIENLDDLKVGDCFDFVDNTCICNKYIVKRRMPQGGGSKKSKKPKISKLIENQFRFHEDTMQFGKNSERFHSDDIISITYKLHGTSVVISKIHCKKKLNIIERILKFCRINVVDKAYDNIYSSRKVVKNDELATKPTHYYNVDIWGMVNDKLKDYLLDGMTLYAEIVGYLPNGSHIQKHYDYGVKEHEHEVYIYRITYTNTAGQVFEFSAKQVQDWCRENNLKPAPQLYYGKVRDLFPDTLGDDLTEALKKEFLEKDCFMCKNKLPAEGIVIRKECNHFEAYKLKSFRFLERETKMLDKGEEDIEEG